MKPQLSKSVRYAVLLISLALVLALMFKQSRTGLATEMIDPQFPAACSTLSPKPSPPNPSCTIPTNVPNGNGYGELGDFVSGGQVPFDTFSWQSFVALNCPGPIPNQTPTDPLDNIPRVWETYTDAIDLYRPNDPVFTRLRAKHNSNNDKVLRLMAKNEHFHGGDLAFLEATGYPLIDRNLNFVLYEIRLNPDEVAYVKKYHLNNFKGQYAFLASGNKVNFPAGPTEFGPTGAIEIKAAWRILDTSKGDDPTRFYTRRADIYIESQFTQNHQPLYINDALVGLVGMHVIHKTPTESEWIWSTFEQVDNTTGQYGKYPLGKPQVSFFNAACVGTCGINEPPSANGDTTYLWAPTPPYAGKYATAGKFGTQVVRASYIHPETECINDLWQPTMTNTQWKILQNYEVIGTQWSAFGFRVPKVLANSVLETYNQGDSCMDCHKTAQTATLKKPADFSFTLGLARPIPAKLAVRK